MLVNCAGSCRSCSQAVEAPVYTGQPWRLFSVEGEPLESMAGYEQGGIALLFEGGQWIWPGVMVGFERTINVGDKSVTLETMALQVIQTEHRRQFRLTCPAGLLRLTCAPTTAPTIDDPRSKTAQPLVLSVSNFLSEAECEHVISQSEPHMAPSQVSRVV